MQIASAAMRRSMMILGIVLVATLLASCSDDDGEGTDTGLPTTAPGEPVDVSAAEARLETVCRRSVSEDLFEDCLEAAQAAVQQASDSGCPAVALDAWAEHIAASAFATTPHDEFFAHCPVPLSNLVLPSAPAPYRPVVGQRGTGLLDRRGVAAGFVASDEIEAFLGDIDHQVSYAAAWVDGDEVVLIRLDRFEGPDQAAAFLDSDHRPVSQSDLAPGDTRQIPGILQGNVTAHDSLRLATGRVCEVAMTLMAQGTDGGGLSTDEVAAWFSDQARRVQTAVSC